MCDSSAHFALPLAILAIAIVAIAAIAAAGQAIQPVHPVSISLPSAKSIAEPIAIPTCKTNKKKQKPRYYLQAAVKHPGAIAYTDLKLDENGARMRLEMGKDVYAFTR